MKIILSRKGFDSAAGEMPSPIMSDGALLSLPIPAKEDPVKYSELEYNGKNYRQIIVELSNGKFAKEKCHLDPDLRKDAIPRTDANWKPCFGQCEAALSHLRNQGVGVGDLFLFFGLFRQAEVVDGKYQFVKNAKPQHIIWGYMQVGEIVDNPQKTDFPYNSKHPHVNRPDFKQNAIYVAADKLSFSDCAGSGIFKYDDRRVLTKAGESPSRWTLQPVFAQNINISYHSEKSRKDGYFQSAGRGQEFVITADGKPAVMEWVKEIMEL
jgi:hypothetical protein